MEKSSLKKFLYIVVVAIVGIAAVALFVYGGRAWRHVDGEYGITANGQYELGKRYGSGDGVNVDKAEAVKWYRKAAERGHAEAQRDLGICCIFGIGTDGNKEEALKWLVKAAEQGDEMAKDVLRQLNGEDDEEE